MTMSKADWAEVEERLQSLYDTVELDCDGYRLSLRLSRIGTYKNAIMVYVNGWLKGSWILEDCEERRRFYRPITKRRYSKKITKTLTIKMAKAIGIDRDATITYFNSHWSNFAAMRRHLIKNNKDISLIREETKEPTCA